MMGLAHLLTPFLLALPLAAGAGTLKASPPLKRSGPAAYANALRKWGKLHAEEGSPGLMKRLSEELEAHSHDNDTFYTVDVEVGSPAQTLPVILDTGSADTWVYWSMTDYGGLGKSDWPVHYDLAESSTSFHIADAEWSVQYADGSIASGPVALDTLSLSTLRLPNTTLQLANASSPGLLSSGTSGVLGLARDLPTSISPIPAPTVRDRLVADGVAFLSIDLRRGGGSYALSDGHAEGVSWFESWGPHWSVDVDVKSGSNSSSFEGVVDTGTTLLLLPDHHVTAYWIDVPSARHDAAQEMWLFPCAQRTSLPDLHLRIGGAYDAVVPGSDLDFGAVEERGQGVSGAAMCYGGVQSSEGLGVEAILGDVFLKSQLVVLGLEDGRVGFAEKTRSLE